MTEWERLVYEAKDKCEGCRTSWGRIRRAAEAEAAWHDAGGGRLVACTAMNERRKIRALTPASG
jgi:hypothetical protein